MSAKAWKMRFPLGDCMLLMEQRDQATPTFSNRCGKKDDQRGRSVVVETWQQSARAYPRADEMNRISSYVEFRKQGLSRRLRETGMAESCQVWATPKMAQVVTDQFPLH